MGQWFAWYVCAFLFGAAAGGWIFGRLGDRFGRVRAMGWSILCLSVFSGLAYWAASPSQLLLLRFLACLGIGGMWPNGVAIVSEAWSDLSRPILAGIMGTAANVGLLLMAVDRHKHRDHPSKLALGHAGRGDAHRFGSVRFGSGPGVTPLVGWPASAQARPAGLRRLHPGLPSPPAAACSVGDRFGDSPSAGGGGVPPIG